MRESRSQRSTYVVLVGGSHQVSESQQWCVCLLEPKETEVLLDFESTLQQNITVKMFPNRQLRVQREWQKLFKVPQNRFDTRSVPTG